MPESRLDQILTLETTAYRGHNPAWSFAADSGEGASITGGRFNPKGTPTLYTSLSPQGAWNEAQQSFPFKAQPLTICAYRVHCADMLDLTDPNVLTAWEITPAELACPWKWLLAQGQQPSSWSLAKRLMKHKIAGVIVPSFARAAAPETKNVVFWRWGNRRPHKVEVVDDHDRLPKDPSSWR